MTDAFVGIDIGKFKFDVAVLSLQRRAKHRAFSNDQEGFDKLIAWLSHTFVWKQPVGMAKSSHTTSMD